MSEKAFSAGDLAGPWAERLGAMKGHSAPSVSPVSPVSPANRPTIPMPRRLNLGSGKSWHPDFVNLDISAFWKPDVVADFGKDFFGGSGVFETERFGPIRIEKNSFELVAAHDVLEHVSELTTCMKNALDLLAVGGIFDILVPYDLSYGAWQDPTHVRAFNEKSWLYYTEWFWYLGWNEARFETVKLDFNLSEMGQGLAAGGMANEQIAITPRAVDSMRVLLRKIPLSDEDRRVLAHHQKGPQR